MKRIFSFAIVIAVVIGGAAALLARCHAQPEPEVTVALPDLAERVILIDEYLPAPQITAQLTKRPIAGETETTPPQEETRTLPDTTPAINAAIKAAQDPQNDAWMKFIKSLAGDTYAGLENDADVQAAVQKAAAACMEYMSYETKEVELYPQIWRAVAVVEVTTFSLEEWFETNRSVLLRRAFVLPVGNQTKKRQLLALCDAVGETVAQNEPQTRVTTVKLALHYDVAAGEWVVENPDALIRAAIYGS